MENIILLQTFKKKVQHSLVVYSFGRLFTSRSGIQIIGVLALCVVSLFFFSSSAYAQSSYTVDISINNAGAGSVKVEQAGQFPVFVPTTVARQFDVPAGESLTLTAQPLNGTTFLDWAISTQSASTDNPLVITPTQNMIIRADFTAPGASNNTLTLNFSPSGGSSGALEITEGSSTQFFTDNNTYQVPPGQSVTVQALDQSGHTFSRFETTISGYSSTTNRSITFTPTRSETINVFFSAIGVPAPNLQAIVSGSTVNLGWSAVSDPGGGGITYDIRQNGATIQTGLSARSYTVTGLSNGSYSFEVRAKNSLNQYSNWSSPKTATIGGGGTGGPTCTDGQRNGNETGVDCGGPDCSACTTTTPPPSGGGPAGGLVPCTMDGTPGEECGFDDFVDLMQNIIRFIFSLIIPLAAIMLVITGFMYITSGGDTGRRSQAKKYFINFGYGLIAIMLAWVIVATIFRMLGVPDAYVLLAI